MRFMDAMWGATRERGGKQALKHLAREVRWAGSAVICPCCEWQGRAFRPGCEDRPGVPFLCARCMSGPDDRAIWLVLKALTEELPALGRVLDVEPSAYTRQWFDRFNQIDYRTLGRTDPDVHIVGDLATVSLTKGICHLIVCARGIDQEQDLMATVMSLDRLLGDGGMVMVRADRDGAVTTNVRHALEEAGFTVTVNDLAQRVPPEVVQRYGLERSAPILIGALKRQKSQAASAHHGHAHS
jgi:hypothetical protein